MPAPTTEQVEKLKEVAGIPKNCASPEHLALTAFLYLYLTICQKRGYVVCKGALPPLPGEVGEAGKCVCLLLSL